MNTQEWAVGVDLGGTKIQFIQVNADGSIGEMLRYHTEVIGGVTAIQNEIIKGIAELQLKVGRAPVGVGIGMAGQVEKETGFIHFAPNLKWHNVPFQQTLAAALGLQVAVLNDVRAATYGEWLKGAGQNCNNLLCIFIGTGIGGGIICNGVLLEGSSNTAGEIGHMTVDLHGPLCACGNSGCVEAFAGGWAMIQRAKEAIVRNPSQGAFLLAQAGGNIDLIDGHMLTLGARSNDPLSKEIIANAVSALSAAAISLVNAFNPQKIILGGGVLEAMPELLPELVMQVRKRALSAATLSLEIVPAALHNNAGAVGAALLALQRFKGNLR